MTWTTLAQLLAHVYQLHQHHWQCGLPPAGMIATEALESECDTWSRKLVAGLPEPTFPPEFLQPWLLLRLKCALAHCLAAEKSGDECPGPPPLPVVEYLIVESWPDLRIFWRDKI